MSCRKWRKAEPDSGSHTYDHNGPFWMTYCGMAGKVWSGFCDEIHSKGKGWREENPNDTYSSHLTLNLLGRGLITPPRVFRNNPGRYQHETWHDPPDINSTSFGVKKKSDSGKTIVRYSRFCDVTSRDFGAKKDKCLKIRQKYVCDANCKKTTQKMVLEQF